MEVTPPRRLFKTHGALEAGQRGSPAYKERLRKRAFARVTQHREAILSRARSGDSGATKQELKNMLDSEVQAMECDDEDTCMADLPDHLYEEILYEMCLQIQNELEAERYEEFERFDEEALLNAIEANPSASSVEPMDMSD
jgi:hypothetical protein